MAEAMTRGTGVRQSVLAKLNTLGSILKCTRAAPLTSLPPAMTLARTPTILQKGQYRLIGTTK